MSATHHVSASASGGLSAGGNGSGPWRLSPAAVVFGATILALALRVFLLTRPGFLVSGVVEYDDGVYLGAAIRLLHGALPYRDYAFVQPPGILLVALPGALVASVTSPAAGLAAARVLTVCASSACVPLAGSLVRHRGALVTAVTCGFLAVYPSDVLSARTLLLEPWMNLCCLLAANAAFREGRLADPRRLGWAGVALGFGAAIKFWAAVPAILLLAACLAVRSPRRAVACAAGFCCGFAVPAAPFLGITPTAFVRATLLDQITRIGSYTPLSLRLAHLTGLVDVLNRDGKVTALPAHSLFAMAGNATTVIVDTGWAPFTAAAGAAAAVGAGYLRRPRERSHLEWFALATAAVSSAAILGYSAFFYHYPDFPAPWIAIVAGAAVGGAVARPAAARRRFLAAGAALMIIAVTFLQARELAGVRVPASPGAVSAIPAGSCVFTDQVSFTIAADRFAPVRPGCPDVLDALATTLVLSGGVSAQGGAARQPRVVTGWEAILGQARYVWLSDGYRQRIPWTAGLHAWFSAHFRLVAVFPGYADSRLYVSDRAGRGPA
jgi:hypothetical protein